MDLCNLCDEPLMPNEKVKWYHPNIFKTDVAHLECYNIYHKLSNRFLSPSFLLLIPLYIFMVLGLISLIDRGDNPMLSYGVAILFVVLACLCLVATIVLYWVYWTKLKAIKKNPPKHEHINNEL